MSSPNADSPQTLHRRGVEAFRAGLRLEGIDLLRRAAEAGAGAAAYGDLALALATVGRVNESVAACQRAAALAPNVPEIQSNLGNALQMAGRLDEAVEAYAKALALKPDYTDAKLNLAHAHTTLGAFDRALALLEPIVAAQPELYPALVNLGTALHGKGDLDGATAAYRRALDVRPNSAEVYANLALTFKDAARLNDALDCYRRSLALRPDPAVADGYLFLIHYHPDFNARAILREHQAWYRQYLQGRVRPPSSHGNDRTPDRRLRIGYVSPDFRAHPVGYNLLPLFENHDHARFEVFCYADVIRPDALTETFRTCADHWHDLRGVTDDDTVARVREDRIDVLVDLALHTGQNRLGVFAQKPAPVQFTFAGYPSTTGVPAIGYRLTDAHLDPPGATDDYYTESSIRLPHCFWCYQPVGDEPAVGPLPALANGYVTFGCLNNFCKVSDGVIDLWSRVLTAVGGSQLLLLSKFGTHRDRTRAAFAGKGVDPGRIEFVAPGTRDAYLQAYHRIDVGLDTFPYNGHTTSLDALWMGVPVVTRVGETAVGRAGWSQLNQLWLDRLAAREDGSFVGIARELAGDLAALERMRTTLRERVSASPLADATAFARGVEAAYRSAWGRWCEAGR